GQRAWRAELGRFLREADVTAGAQLTPAEAVTLDCTREAAAQELQAIDLAAAEYTVTAMQYARPAAFLSVAARTGPGALGAGRADGDRLGARRHLARPDRRAAAERGRPGAAAGRPAGRAGHHLGRGGPGRPGRQPGAFPPAAAGVASGGGVGTRAPGGGRGGGAPRAGQVGGHRQGTAPAGPAVRAGRAGLPPRRGRGLRPGDPDLYHLAAVPG